MASRIKYKPPLRSVRTVRALKIEHEEPPVVSFDGTLGDLDTNFAWEDAPEHSTTEQEQDGCSSLELKRPPDQERILAHVDETEPLPTPPVWTPAEGRSAFSHPLPPKPSPAGGNSAFSHQLPPKPSTAQGNSAFPKPSPAEGNSAFSHQLPPKPSPAQGKSTVSHQLPPKPPQTMPSFSGAVYQQSGAKPPPIPKKTVATSGDSAVVHAQQQSGVNSSLSSSTLHSPFRQRYLAERFEGGNNFFANASAVVAQANPLTRLAFEVGSQNEEDWDGDQTDAGDNNSHMNMRDRDGRCQVSVLDGELLSSERQSDSSGLRDFIMERFLPAAKAMASESSDAVLDSSSSQEAVSVSPYSGRARSSLPGRSRFAFKDRFAEEEDVQDQEKLFNCKFPWQYSPLAFSGPLPGPSLEPRSGGQSPSESRVQRAESFPGMYQDKRQIEAWIDADSETPNKSRSFEDRGLPPKCRGNQSRSNDLYSRLSRSGELGSFQSSMAPSFSEESANGDVYEGDVSGRSNDTSGRADVGDGRTHGLQEGATLGEQDNMSLSTTQHGKPTGAPGEAAVQSEPEPIPPSSILNHQRNRPGSNSSIYFSADVSTSSTFDNGGNSSKSLTVSLVRSRSIDASGISGRSMDDVWDRIVRDSSTGAESPALASFDGQERVLHTRHTNPSDSGNDDLGIPAWQVEKGYNYNAYARTPSSDSKDASSSFSDQSLRSPSNNGSSSPQDKYSPVSVLPPPLPKSPSESWLSKLRPPAPPSGGTNWRGTNHTKVLQRSLTNACVGAKWEDMVKSADAHLRNNLA